MKRQTMKKVSVMALALAASGGASVVHAATSVELNGQPLMTAVAPVNMNGRTLVPMRDIFEALGATVNYNSLTRGIIAQRASTTVNLQIGNKEASVNDRTVALEQAPLIIRGATMVPLRFVSEAMGAQVEWNNSRELVSIRQGGGTAVASYRTISVPSGAVVPVVLDEALSSATARNGDKFTATVKTEAPGDSEFPAGTQIEGVVTEALAKSGKNAGALALDFRNAILPDGTRVPLRGTPITLDSDNVSQTQGRIMAKQGKDNTGRNVLIGGGAGFVLGKVIDKNSVLTGVLGAAAGYFLSQKDKNKVSDVSLAAGTQLGVRLDRAVSYADTSGYADERARHFKM